LSEQYQALCSELSYNFKDINLLERALTHRSKGTANYERLEFLGDSIVGFVIASELFSLYPDLSEGKLTRLRATLVRKETLAQLARNINLGQHIKLGSGELKSGGFDRDSILADCLEAIFGAIYKDGTIKDVTHVIKHLYQATIKNINPDSVQTDPKTKLQEYLQKIAKPLPEYKVIKVTGQPHNQTFSVECKVTIFDKVVTGTGASRKKAEQDAAEKTIKLINEPV
jgi:ribonuclease-3